MSPDSVGIVTTPLPTVSVPEGLSTDHDEARLVPLKSSRNVPAVHEPPAFTVTATVALPVPPLPSLTVTFAVNEPAAAYVCEGFCCVETAVASPKSHEYVSVSPSASVPVAVNATAVPVGTLPVGV